MPSPAAVLFPTVTESPAREFIAAQLAAAKVKTLILPAAGRFATAAAAVPVIGAGHIHAYDTTLLASLIGRLADPAITLDSLGVEVPPELQLFVADVKDPFELAAGNKWWIWAQEPITTELVSAYSDFKIVADQIEYPDGAAINPARHLMHELLIAAGGKGYKVGDLVRLLDCEGLGVHRNTLHEWLRVDEKRGWVRNSARVPNDPYARWTWCKPTEGADAQQASAEGN